MIDRISLIDLYVPLASLLELALELLPFDTLALGDTLQGLDYTRHHTLLPKPYMRMSVQCKR